MAVRQYIGARYVPKFYENSLGTAEWQPNVAYEPLTIVTFNGNSFTSKKAVPVEVGDPSNNRDYWASTGIYNQQIEEYRQDVQNLRDYVENNVVADIDEINDKITFIFSEDGSDIGAALNAALAAGNVMLNGGNYNTSVPIIVPKGHTLDGANGCLKYTGVSIDDYLVTLGDREAEPRDQALTMVCNITLECEGMINGILDNIKRGNVSTVRILAPKTVGIDIYRPDSTVTPGDAEMAFIDIYNIYDKNAQHYVPYGIRVNATDNNIHNIRTLGTVVGVQVNAGGLFMSDVHPLAFDSSSAIWTDTIGFEINASAFGINLYTDNFKIGYKVAANAEFAATNIYNYYWETNSPEVRKGIQFDTNATVKVRAYHAYSGALCKEVEYIGENADVQSFPSRLMIEKVNAPTNSDFKVNDLGNIITQPKTYLIRNAGTPAQSDRGVLIGVISNQALFPTPSTGWGAIRAKISINSPDMQIEDVILKSSGQFGAHGRATYNGSPTTLSISTYKDENSNIYIFLKAIGTYVDTVNILVDHYSLELPPQPITEFPELTSIQTVSYLL